MQVRVLVQILAGNARKVSAVRFERINNDEASVESRGVTRFLSKLWRRRSNSDDESDTTEGDEVPVHNASNDHVMCVQEDNADEVSKQQLS